MEGSYQRNQLKSGRKTYRQWMLSASSATGLGTHSSRCQRYRILLFEHRGDPSPVSEIYCWARGRRLRFQSADDGGYRNRSRYGGVILYPLERQRMDNSIQVAERYGLSGADSVVVALAEELNVPLITFDREILNRFPAGISMSSEQIPAAAPSLSRLIQELQKLPGVGPKSAQRLAYYLIRLPSDDALRPGRRHNRGKAADCLLPRVPEPHRRLSLLNLQ